MQQRFLLQILLLAQHVSGITMPIIRSSILQTGHTTLSTTPDQQLENHSTKYHRQQPLYNTLELLMMGIVMPETCWASNKMCTKNLCCIYLVFYFHILTKMHGQNHIKFILKYVYPVQVMVHTRSFIYFVLKQVGRFPPYPVLLTFVPFRAIAVILQK